MMIRGASATDRGLGPEFVLTSSPGPLPGLGLEGECEEVGHGGEGEDPGEGEEEVEHRDQEVVRSQDPRHLGLVLDGGDEAGDGVVAHEGVHRHPEHHGRRGQVRHGRAAVLLRGVRDPLHRQRDHRDEGRPPHHRGEHLQVLRLGHVEVGEGPEDGEEDGHVDPVDVGAVEAGGEVAAGAARVLGGVGGGGAGDVTQRLGHGRDVDSQVPEQVGSHAQVERNSEEEK